MKRIKELQDKREQLASEIRQLGDAFNEQGKQWQDGQQENWDRLNADYDQNKVELDAENKKLEDDAAIKSRLEALSADGDAPAHNHIGRDGGRIDDAHDPVEIAGCDALEGGPSLDDRVLAMQAWLSAGAGLEHTLTAKHRKAVQACGVNPLGRGFTMPLNRSFKEAKRNANALRNALSSQDGSSGGYTIGETFVNNLELAMLSFGGMFQVSDVIRTATGEPMRWPTADDTGNTGAQVGEGESVDGGDDPSFGQVLWNAYKFTSKIVKVPHEVLQNSAFDLASYLSEMLGERLGRIQNTKYTTGNGAGTAKGIVTCATAGLTAASATAIAFDEVIDLEHALDPSRRNLSGVGYMFHDNILKSLRKLKDGNGNYLWQTGANSGAPDTLNQYPYQINQDMASAITTGAVTMLFGQLSQYKIRQVANIRMRRLDERFADTDQVGFVAFVEGDGNLLDAGDGPVRKLTQA